MSPYQIELLLWYYYTPCKCEKPRTELFYHNMNNFVKLGLIHKGPNPIENPDYDQEYHGNGEALRAYVDALEAVPLPVQRWTVEQPLNINPYKTGNN